MFRKVLIANRGEIALRIARTCRRLGVASVAVYSEADQAAPHVGAADEAVPIGPSEPEHSYLSIAALVAAARQTGADALHPGYGFLSERAELAAACADAGIAFVGPTAGAMRALGDKIGARRLAAASGVAVAPGYDGDDQSAAVLAGEAGRIGFPLLIKASAGGGGRGMRVVARAEELAPALAAAQAEAVLAFGDGRVLLERLVDRARHVEVQLLADRHGAALAVGDRDCSAQRRHQKLIEEAPAPDLAPEVREGLHRAAERLAVAAGYSGAGTAEFLVAGDDAFFLELNARLQVEHTVTEETTGLDLVEWQLRLAAGERLGLTAEDVRPAGHAIQARVYAEDPGAGFLPSPGRVLRVRWPEGVRTDASVTADGQVIPPHYDPLVGKVISWGPDRRSAVRRLVEALGDTVVLGVATNTAYLRRLLMTPEFARGPIDTAFVARHPTLLEQPPPPPEVLDAVVEAARSGRGPWRSLAGWRAAEPAAPVQLRWGERVLARPPRASPGQGVVVAEAAGASGQRCFEAAWQGSRWQLTLDAPVAPAVTRELLAGAAEGARAASGPGRGQPSAPGNWFVEAPLPGKLTRVDVQPGQQVAAGEPTGALHAMKMEHTILATRPGRVVQVLAAAGALVRANEPLVEFAPAGDPEVAGAAGAAGGTLAGGDPVAGATAE